MSARIFSGDSWVGGVLGRGAGFEDDEGEVEVCRVRAERSNSLRRAIALRDMVYFG